MGTSVNWEGNVGNAPEHRSFPNGNQAPRQMLRLNVFFDNSIPDGKGGYKDRGGFWANVEWWHPDAERFAQLFQKGMRVLVSGRAIMDSWQDKGTGQEVSALKVEANRVAILPHRVELVSLAPPKNSEPRANQAQGQARSQTNGGQAQQVPQPSADDLSAYEQDFDSDFPL